MYLWVGWSGDHDKEVHSVFVQWEIYSPFLLMMPLCAIMHSYSLSDVRPGPSWQYVKKKEQKE